MSDDYTIWEYAVDKMRFDAAGAMWLDHLALESRGMAGWELCGVSRDALIYKRPRGSVMSRTIPAEQLRQAAGEAP